MSRNILKSLQQLKDIKTGMVSIGDKDNLIF